MKLLDEIWSSLDGSAATADAVTWIGSGSLPSVFAVSDLAAASIATAGLATADWLQAHGGARPAVEVDRRLASMWFATSLRPLGWSLPPPWDAVAGDYACADGWIRLHTNAPAHREAALAVLGVPADKAAVADAVARWPGDALEDAVVARGGCAARMRSVAEWAAHPQGRAVAAEPLFISAPGGRGAGGEIGSDAACDVARPLAGVRVLDLTRVLAGPVCTRFLAGLGAEVLRIDPPGWDEPGVVPEVTLGKRTARLDLHETPDRLSFERLLAGADAVVHGLRPDALARLGYDAQRRAAIRPGLVDVSLDAYGWSGPWAGRRGFDSLVQMSAGIAEAGMRGLARERPTPLPVQALDHATGYLLAAAVLRGLTERLRRGHGVQTRTSLAAVARLLAAHRVDAADTPLRPESADDLADAEEATAWGPARRLRSPIHIGGAPLRWDLAASALGSSEARWR
jgi:hypothetical protein